MNRFPTLVPLLLDGSILGLLTKVSVLIALAAVATAVARHASAAVRHFIWAIALGGCVTLAVLTPAAPAVVIEVPRAAPTVVRTIAPVFALTRTTRPLAMRLRPGLSSVIATPSTVNVVIDAPEPGVFERARAWLASHSTLIAACVWLFGCLVVLARCALAHAAVDRIVGDADDAPLRHRYALAATIAELGIERDVRLLVSPSVPAPITSGVRSPVVLLPRESDTWSDERVRVVLLHELAHVARLDYLTQMIATAACALFWFHPGVWLAAARLRSECELAADDRVLAAGLHGVSYASHLLELATTGRASRVSSGAAVGMARTSHLEGRFRAMLDSSRSRSSLSARAQAAVVALGFLALVPVAGLRTELIAAPRPRSHRSFVNRAVPAVAPMRGGRSVTSGSASIALATAFDSSFEQTVNAAMGERLMLDLSTGGTVVIQGWDEPRVRLRARLGGRDWRETRVSLERVGTGVRLRSDMDDTRRSSSTSHVFELWVPRSFDVRVASAGGGIAIRDVSGEFSGHTGGGNIEIERARGFASLTTGGGDVVVMDSDLTGDVRSGSGDSWSSSTTRVRGNGAGFGAGVGAGSMAGQSVGYSIVGGVGTTTIGAGTSAIVTGQGATTISGGVGGGVGGGVATTVGGGIGGGVASTVTGQVAGAVAGRGVSVRAFDPYNLDGRTITSTATTTFTNDRAGDLLATTIASEYGGRGTHISKSGGSISLSTAPDGAVLFTGGGGITVGSSGAFLSATTGGGDVELLRVAGDANVNTGAGDVTISVINDGTRAHSVLVRSGHGRVEIELPADLDARFDIETAYTENFSRATRIETDWALDRSETSAWDDREGTPRRYVRAQGVAGNGRGLIRIRTVNGDVTVRRVP